MIEYGSGQSHYHFSVSLPMQTAVIIAFFGGNRIVHSNIQQSPPTPIPHWMSWQWASANIPKSAIIHKTACPPNASSLWSLYTISPLRPCSAPNASIYLHVEMDSVPIVMQQPPSISPLLAIMVHVVRSTWIFHNISEDIEYPHGRGIEQTVRNMSTHRTHLNWSSSLWTAHNPNCCPIKNS